MKNVKIVGLILLIFLACQTVPESIPEDLKPMEYFKEAQLSINKWKDYNTALLYYNTFIERFPEDFAKVVEAEYEIAFIHYKLKQYNIAIEKLNTLLTKYKDNPSGLPEWPKILAEKLLEEIKIITKLDDSEEI